MDDLWTPYETTERKVRPTERKDEGGSYFDDELGSEQMRAAEYAKQTKELLEHLNQRPDHVVYVGDSETRAQLRTVFNHWHKMGALPYHPNIRIDYGVPEGAIRIDEDRG